jgi:DNA-binding transcriptional regulator YbjK
LRKLLGDEKNARFQEYMETRNTRMQVDQFRPQFTGADTLRDDQVEPLIAALHVERAQMQQELKEYGATLASDDASQKYSERRIELMKAAYDRMHAAAAPILSSSQTKRLDALLKRDLERQEAQARMVLVQSKIDSAGTGASKTN